VGKPGKDVSAAIAKIVKDQGIEQGGSRGSWSSASGTLDAPQQDQLLAALDALGDPVVIRATRPGAVLELVAWAGGSASFPLEAQIPPEWQRLRELLHCLVEDLNQQPVGALEVRLGDWADTAVLEVVGTQPVRVSVDGAVLTLSLFAENEDYLRSSDGAAAFSAVQVATSATPVSGSPLAFWNGQRLGRLGRGQLRVGRGSVNSSQCGSAIALDHVGVLLVGPLLLEERPDLVDRRLGHRARVPAPPWLAHLSGSRSPDRSARACSPGRREHGAVDTARF
jgi:hypothetical protein